MQGPGAVAGLLHPKHNSSSGLSQSGAHLTLYSPTLPLIYPHPL